MITPKSFLYETSADGVVTITLNRPERLNALTFDVYRELTDTFAALESEPEARVVVITGAGRAFCSGGDVHEIIGELFNRKPVIASLNGTTAGAGACIALASDIRIASEAAKIAFLFVKVGLSGADMGAAYLLPRVIGMTKATELLYTGDFISAQEAERIGLYNRVVPGDQLNAITRELAERLAEGPAFALAKTKELLDREASMSLDAALECEAQAQAICMQHPDYREAYEAFVNKRAPKFK
jgi:enoyl-CoA hydratase/carnithine racemase